MLIPWWAGQAPPAAPTAVLAGNFITSALRDTTIRIGTRVLTITITGTTWVAAGTAFDAQRDNIINGLVSAGIELFGWNNVVIAALLNKLTSVVRTSNTVVTITFPGGNGASGTSTYRITADETITVTVPGSAVASGAPIVASNTATVSYVGPITPTVTVDYSNTTTSGGGTVPLRYGVLHLDPTKPTDAVLAPLGITYARIGHIAEQPRATAAGMEIDYILSDDWGYPSSSRHTGALWPYDPSTHVQNAEWPGFLAARAAEWSGKTFICEYHNEPNNTTFLPAASLSGDFPKMCADIYAVFSVLSPKPLFAGPSFDTYDTTKITAYLNSCLTAGPGSTPIEVNVLVWHANITNYAQIPIDVADALTRYINNPTYATLNMQRIDINEAGANRTCYSGGALIASLYNCEKAGVRSTPSVWSEVDGSGSDKSQVDGVLTPNPTLGLRSRYFAGRAYATLGTHRVGASTAAAEVVPLANTTGTVVLAHYNNSSTSTVIDATITLTFNRLDLCTTVAGKSAIRVTAKLIPFSVDQVASEPATAFNAVATVTANSASVTLPALQMDEVYQITIADGTNNLQPILDHAQAIIATMISDRQMNSSLEQELRDISIVLQNDENALLLQQAVDYAYFWANNLSARYQCNAAVEEDLFVLSAYLLAGGAA